MYAGIMGECRAGWKLCWALEIDGRWFKNKKLLLGKMAERKVVIMYKDVWKKFGAKILIVMCSILLLGGVAIAAPRLRAADPAVLEETAIPSGEKTTNLVYDYNAGPASEGRPQGAQARYPKSLTIDSKTYRACSTNDNGNSWNADGDYTVAVTGTSAAKDWTQATKGDAKVTVMINPTSVGQTKGLSSDGYTLSYSIYRKTINTTDFDITANNPNYSFAEGDNAIKNKIMIANIGQTVVGSDRFTVTAGGEPVVTSQYKVCLDVSGSELKPTQYGTDKSIYFEMDNYQYDESNNGRFFPASVDFTHHVKDFTLTLNRTDSTSNPTPELTDPYDSSNTVTYPTHYNYTYSKQADGKYCVVITGKTNSCYGVRTSDPYELTTKTYTFRLVEASAGSTGSMVVIPYDETKNTYLITDMDVRETYRVEMRPTSGGNWETVDDWTKITSLGGVIADDSGTVPGATAGAVQQQIQVTLSDGGVASGSLGYYVKRQMSVAAADSKQDGLNARLHIDPPTEGLTCEYDANEHKLVPKIYFDLPDGGKGELRPGKDYKISYKKATSDGQADTEDSDCRNAGTVVMVIEGLGTDGQGGYIGKIEGDSKGATSNLQNLVYRITPKEIKGSTHTLQLGEDAKTVYGLETTQEQIVKDAIVQNQDKTEKYYMSRMVQGTDFVATFYKCIGDGQTPDLENPLDSTAKLDAGNMYALQIKFLGNYTTPDDDMLICKFEIKNYQWSQLIKRVDSTCNDSWCPSGSAVAGHVYTGQAHKPKIILTDRDGVVLPTDIYTVTYKDNIFAGVDTAIATVQLKGDDTTHDMKFTISPRPLKREHLKFHGDGFTQSGTSWTHAYDGKGQIQQLSQVEVSYTIDGRTRPVTDILTRGESGGFTGGDELYYLDGGYYEKLDSLDGADTATEYYYQITLTNPNYTVDASEQTDGNRSQLYVGPFRFAARDFSGVNIEQKVTVMPYPNGGITDDDKAKEQVENYLSTMDPTSPDIAKNLVVTDGTDTLKYGFDYEIADGSISNRIGDNGSIEFKLTGAGCYAGLKDQTVIVWFGKPITQTAIRERAMTGSLSTWRISFNGDTATLKNKYSDNGSASGDRYGISFRESPTALDSDYTTYLYDGSDANKLYKGDKYEVHFNEIEVDTQNNQVYYIIPITGRNGYYGVAKLKFIVEPMKLQNRDIDVEVVGADTYVFEWENISIPVHLNVIDKTMSEGNPDIEPTSLEEGRDYEIKYGISGTNGNAPWRAAVHNFLIVGKGRYTGSISGTYEILPRHLSDPESPITPDVKVTSGGAILGGVVNDDRFTVHGLRPEVPEFEYSPRGVDPSVTLDYRYIAGRDENGNEVWETVTLAKNIGFEANVENGDKVTVPGQQDGQGHARMLFSPKSGDSNFVGSFYEYFNIIKVNLDDSSKCLIKLADGVYDFDAKDIRPGDEDKNGQNDSNGRLIVGQYLDNVQGDDVGQENGKSYVNIDPSEYTVEYTANYYVSEGYTGSDQNKYTQVIVTAKSDGNYSGSLTEKFVIRGDLSAEAFGKEGQKVSETKIDGNIIQYSDISDGSAQTSGMRVHFRQRERDDDTGVANTDVTKMTDRTLEWKKDYDVFIRGENITKLNNTTTIGVYPKDDGTGIRGIEPYFSDFHRPMDIIIQGRLGGEETTVVRDKNNEGNVNDAGDLQDTDIVVQIPEDKTAADMKLQDFIVVTCGGKKLVHGEDYQFNTGQSSGDIRVPNMSPGYNKTVQIEPTPNAIAQGYLMGDNRRTITYSVKQELNAFDVSGIERGQTIMYNHGRDVINLDDIDVKIKGGTQSLVKNRDYEIKFKDDDGKSVGEHAILIIPKGNYSGKEFRIPFTVIRYNLNGLQEGKDIWINHQPTAVYTGSNVFPEIAYVRVNSVTVSGSGIQSRVDLYGKDDVKPGDDREIAYELRPVEGQDNINFQNRTEVECILAGVGNYEGEVRLKYSILQKNIEDMSDGENFDVDFYTDKQEYEYQNGESIKPEPRGEYNGIVFTGQVDNGGGTFGRDVPFTFTYPKDTINVGTKTITITGNGNFTGVRTLDYDIIQLDLAKTDLKFAESELVYDGQEQHPSFTLSYGGKQIVTYDKANGVKSDYINNVKVTFENAINATKPGNLASVTLSFDDKDKENSNYKNTKTASFAIQPASLDNHVTFMYHPEGEAGNMELKSNLKLPWTGESVKMQFPIQEPDFNDTDLKEGEAGALYDFAGKANNGDFLKRADNEDAQPGHGDYTIAFKYVEPDSDDTDVKEGYGDAPTCSFAGKVKVTITGINNYKDSASFWYYIGEDISADGSAKLQIDKTIYNAQKQPPVVIVNGISRSKYNVERYRGEVKNENYIKSDKEIIDAATYYVRIEGNPSKGTYASKPITLTYIIQPRAISNSVVIDGFKKEYNYTGLAICPVGISVTDYIDRTKYKLTENEDYSLTYTNNINVGTATINVNGEGNFKGTAAARFAITSSMISGGSNGTPGGSVSNGSGQISGAVAVTPDDVRVTLDAGNAMYYTGKQLTPAVTISGMTQNTDYTVTYSNNIEVGTGLITITGMGNNTGTITKNFRIVAKLSDCKVTNIPDQQYTGSAVEPLITVTCGNSILTKDKDYTVSFVNNVQIGTATAMIRAAGNSNYIGSLEAKFNIGNNVGGFIVSGYAPTYPYTGSAITPAVTVESGSTRLQQGTDYTVSYENNVDAGSASIIVKGAGKYTGTQTVNFIIEPRSIQVCETTEVEDKTYTGDAYTPSITVRDSGKVLQNGVDYTLTYSDNVNPGLATITIQGLSNNYTGTKKITFRIGGVAVSGLQVSAVNATSIKLKWQQQGYADGYQVCNSKSKVVKTVNGGNDSTTVAGLKPGKTYKYKVRSYTTNSQGERSYSAASAVVTATTKLKTPAVTLKRNGTGRMRIKWTKSTNADGYEIFYKNTKSAKYRRIKKVDDVNTRICNVRGIKSGKKCYVRVRAYKKTGSTTLRSAMSKTKTIKVK